MVPLDIEDRIQLAESMNYIVNKMHSEKAYDIWSKVFPQAHLFQIREIAKKDALMQTMCVVFCKIMAEYGQEGIETYAYDEEGFGNLMNVWGQIAPYIR